MQEQTKRKPIYVSTKRQDVLSFSNKQGLPVALRVAGLNFQRALSYSADSKIDPSVLTKHVFLHHEKAQIDDEGLIEVLPINAMASDLARYTDPKFSPSKHTPEKLRSFKIPLSCLTLSISADGFLLDKLKASTVMSSSESGIFAAPSSAFQGVEAHAVAKAALHPLTSAASQRQLHKLACSESTDGKSASGLDRLIQCAGDRLQRLVNSGVDLSFLEKRVLFGITPDGKAGN